MIKSVMSHDRQKTNYCLIAFCLIGILMAKADEVKPKFEPNWDSLSKHTAAPEWLKDAKLGIYFHWGPYCVPAFGNEWYPRWMHFDGYLDETDKNAYDIARHQVTTYGAPQQAPYTDFIPKFTGEHFDPEEWAELFRQAGAKFAGPVAEHHDGFAMWASKITPWNAKEMGPKRDVLGEMFLALERNGLKRIATFHHDRNLQRYANTWQQETNKGRAAFKNSHFPFIPGLPPTSTDPKLRMLYGNMPEQEWCEKMWLGKLQEVIDNYQPDIIWFDSWLDLIPENFRERFCAYYLNAAGKWGRDVAIVRKQDDLPISFTVNDLEKSREPKALPNLWMTDDTLSTFSWSYVDGMEIKPLYKILHALIDTVSKNGVMLLNISPKADGTIPENQRVVLLGLGDWLKTNGEAIYNTRPWIIAAEGPTAEPSGGFEDRNEFLALEYSAKDIRYTAAKDGKTVYAITLGRPDAGAPILLKSFSGKAGQVADVELLSGRTVKWRAKTDGLWINVDSRLMGEIAMVFKIKLKAPVAME